MLLTETCSDETVCPTQTDISQQKGFSFCNCMTKSTQRFHVYLLHSWEILEAWEMKNQYGHLTEETMKKYRQKQMLPHLKIYKT